MDRPATSCSTLGRVDFIRVPSPAARTMAVAFGMAAGPLGVVGALEQEATGDATETELSNQSRGVHFRSIMQMVEPAPEDMPRAPRAAQGSGRVILGACAASVVALGSVLGTALLLEEPEPAARIQALWDSKLIRTIADSNLPGTKLLPEPVVAALTPVDRTVTGSIGDAPAPRMLFGAQLGTGNSLGELKRLWNRTAGTLGALTLRPIATINDVGEGHELRLVAGPFTDAADAAALCARLETIAPTCAPVPFSGQDLSP
jgi:SPOR domain